VASTPAPKGLAKVILTASTGTLIEWYDFYIFATLATILGAQFFPSTSANGLLAILGTFATGMIVRPFGAVVFGRMGDMLGRKHTFLLTLLMMGFCSTAIGLLPAYKSIGVLAPVLLICLRIIQGLALGGEYGGAAIYLAENAPADRRGFYTSFLQSTATVGLFFSLMLILGLRHGLGESAFTSWGWRIPFLLSGILVVFSYFVRRTMVESPIFAELKAKGATSKNPLLESFTNPENRRNVLLALFGLTAGQGVVWHTGHFYSLYFLQTTLNIRMPMANEIEAIALVLGAPFFIVFGSLSDRVGRKKLVMIGLALAVIGYLPLYSTMERFATFDDANHGPLSISKTTTIDPASRDAIVTRTISSTDRAGIFQSATNRIDPKHPERTIGERGKFEIEVPPPTFWLLVAIVWYQVICATLVYGPMAAFLVEMFPVRIRYTSLSVPYHLGNGVFGGLVGLVSTWLVTQTHYAVAGVLYPTAIALMSLIVGMLFVRETRGVAVEE